MPLLSSSKEISLIDEQSPESLVLEKWPKDRTVRSSLRRLPNRLLRSLRKRTFDKYAPKARWLLKHYLYGPNLNLVNFSTFASKSAAVKSIPIFPASEIQSGDPKFIGYHPKIDPFERKVISPAVAIIEYRDAMAISGTDFVIKGKTCIHPDLFVPKRDYPMAEHFGEMRLFPDDGQMVHCSFEPPIEMEAAISIMGQCAGSYAHFMSEVLPKLAIVDQRSEYDGIPLLIDSWLDHTLVRIIERFNVKRRPILKVFIRRPVRAKRLITVTPTSYTPPELRDVINGLPKPKIEPSTHKFSADALRLVRDAAHKIVPEPANWIGEKLYLRRRPSWQGNGRGILNEGNIVDLAVRAGFDPIDPSSLTIEEQIAAFRKAKVVIAPIGATLVNLMFAEPGCKIICLSAFYKNAEYDYHAQMQKAFGHDIRFVVGPHLPNQFHHIMHRDFRIPMSDVAEAIKIMS